MAFTEDISDQPAGGSYQPERFYLLPLFFSLHSDQCAILAVLVFNRPDRRPRQKKNIKLNIPPIPPIPTYYTLALYTVQYSIALPYYYMSLCPCTTLQTQTTRFEAQSYYTDPPGSGLVTVRTPLDLDM